MSYFIYSIGQVLLKAISIYRILLLIYFLMSWLPDAYNSDLGRILTKICEPYVGFFRKFIPPIGYISLAGIFALISLEFIENGLRFIIYLLI